MHVPRYKSSLQSVIFIHPSLCHIILSHIILSPLRRPYQCSIHLTILVMIHQYCFHICHPPSAVRSTKFGSTHSPVSPCRYCPIPRLLHVLLILLPAPTPDPSSLPPGHRHFHRPRPRPAVSPDVVPGPGPQRGRRNGHHSDHGADRRHR